VPADERALAHAKFGDRAPGVQLAIGDGKMRVFTKVVAAGGGDSGNDDGEMKKKKKQKPKKKKKKKAGGASSEQAPVTATE
jgi:hypothetical protein